MREHDPEVLILWAQNWFAQALERGETFDDARQKFNNDVSPLVISLFNAQRSARLAAARLEELTTGAPQPLVGAQYTAMGDPSATPMAPDEEAAPSRRRVTLKAIATTQPRRPCSALATAFSMLTRVFD